MNWLELMKAQILIMTSLFEAAQAENRDFTEEEQVEYDAAKAEHERLKAAKKQADELEDMKNNLPQDPVHNPASNSQASHNNVSAGDDLETKKPYANLGSMLVDVVNVAKNPDAKTIQTLKNASGQNTEVGSDGGFAVPQTFMSDMLGEVENESNLASRVSQLDLTQGNTVNIPGVDETSRADGYRFGGIQTYWIREGGTMTPKKVKIRNFELKLSKLAGFVYLTEEMMEDGPVMQQFVEMAFPAEMAFEMDQAIYSGDGNGIPLGYMNSNALVSINRATADTVEYGDVIGMWARMPARRISRSAWFVTQEVLTKLPLMNLSVGTGGSAVFIPAGGASAAPYGTLLGRPIVVIEQAVALGTKGDVTFCDLSDYIAITKGGLRRDVSIHVKFLQDEQALRFVRRINGAPYTKTKLQSKAKSTFYTSPYIALDVPAS